jgi:predicted GIY-YIG superfamily endonuclease
MVTKTKKEIKKAEELKELKLAWTTERRKPDDLVPYEANPRTISATQKEVLIKSLNKFDLVELPVINKDNTVVAGHQRLAILKLLGRGQEEIEIRIPNRQLTPDEFKEYLLTSNRNSGDWDWNILKNFNKDNTVVSRIRQQGNRQNIPRERSQRR